MDWVYLLTSFEGRISRKTFWIAIAVLVAAEILAHFIAEALQGDRLSAIIDLAFTYPEFAIAAKRANDRDLPIWILIVFFGGGAVLDLLTVLGLVPIWTSGDSFIAVIRTSSNDTSAVLLAECSLESSGHRSFSLEAG